MRPANRWLSKHLLFLLKSQLSSAIIPQLVGQWALRRPDVHGPVANERAGWGHFDRWQIKSNKEVISGDYLAERRVLTGVQFNPGPALTSRVPEAIGFCFCFHSGCFVVIYHQRPSCPPGNDSNYQRVGVNLFDTCAGFRGRSAPPTSLPFRAV